MKWDGRIIKVSVISYSFIILVAFYIVCCRPAIRSPKISAADIKESSRHEYPPGEISWETLSDNTKSYQKTLELLQDIMKEHGVTALSIAIMSGIRKSIIFNLGMIDPQSKKQVTDKTVFHAGLLSQPVFSWLVMKLVNDGLIELDKPLERYLKHPLSDYPEFRSLNDDSRSRQLTARLILSHQSGLPNTKQLDSNQSFKFISSPGKQFGYSDMAYRILQLALEELTGRNINDLAKEKVFDRLSMAQTSFICEPRFSGNIASNEDAIPDIGIKGPGDKCDAAHSLWTTGSDYLKFISNILLPSVEMSIENWHTYWASQTGIHSESLYSFNETDKKVSTKGLSWTLGWGKILSPIRDILFHGGKEAGFESFAAIYVWPFKAIVILGTTTEVSKTFTGRILKELMEDNFTPLEWMGFR